MQVSLQSAICALTVVTHVRYDSLRGSLSSRREDVTQIICQLDYAQQPVPWHRRPAVRMCALIALIVGSAAISVKLGEPVIRRYWTRLRLDGQRRALLSACMRHEYPVGTIVYDEAVDSIPQTVNATARRPREAASVERTFDPNLVWRQTRYGTGLFWPKPRNEALLSPLNSVWHVQEKWSDAVRFYSNRLFPDFKVCSGGLSPSVDVICRPGRSSRRIALHDLVLDAHGARHDRWVAKTGRHGHATRA